MNTQRKALDGSKPCLARQADAHQRHKVTLTLPLTAISAPPDARAEDGIMDVHDGNIMRDNGGMRSREESETSKVAAPPAPVHAAQLPSGEW